MKSNLCFRLVAAVLLFLGVAEGQTLVLGPGHQEFQAGPPGVIINNPDGTQELIGTGLIGGIHVGSGSGVFPAISAKAQTGATPCDQLLAATTLSASGGIGLDVMVDFTSADLACPVNPIASSFAGNLIMYSGHTFHMYNGASWVVPTKTIIHGTGSGAAGVGVFSLQACNADLHAYCGSNGVTPVSQLPLTPNLCLISCSLSANTQGFGTLVEHMTSDCSGIAGCVSAMNLYCQENCGFIDLAAQGWDNNGRGLWIGTSTGAGSGGNSIYRELNFTNSNVDTKRICQEGATGLYIDTQTGGPKEIADITIGNTYCNTLNTNNGWASWPKYNVNVVTAGTQFVGKNHGETFEVAHVLVGGKTTGYGAYFTATTSAGAITGTTQVSGGANYSASPIVNVYPTTCTGGTLTPVVSGGVITSLTNSGVWSGCGSSASVLISISDAVTAGPTTALTVATPEACCVNAAYSGTAAVVAVASGASTEKSLKVENEVCGSPNAPTNLINDANHSAVSCAAGGNSETIYATDGAQNVIADSSGTNPVTLASQLKATEPTGSIWGSATGGAKGAGTINAQGLYVNGTAVGGSTAFNAISSGTNSTAAMVLGSGSSLISSGTGQLIGDSNWYNIANGTLFPFIPSASVSNTGGSLGQGTVFFRLTYVGLSTIIPSAELSVSANTTNCASNSTCQITLTMPTSCTAGNLPSGVTGCTVWTSSVNNLEKQQNASANCVNITTTTCVVSVIPGGSTLLSSVISSSSGILPSPLTSVTQPDFCIPTNYIQIGDGSFFPYACIDTTALNAVSGTAGQAGTNTTAPVTGNIPGTYTISYRTQFNDTATAPILSNTLLGIHHQQNQTTGGLTSPPNPGQVDDRGFAVEVVNANTANPYVKQYLAQYNELQVQNNNFQCAPNSGGGNPTTEDCGASGRFNVTDSRTVNNSPGGTGDDAFTGVHGIAYASPVSGTAIAGAQYVGVTGGAGPTVASLVTTGTSFIGGMFGTAMTASPSGTGSQIAVKLIGPGTKIPSGSNYGLWLDNNFNAGGTTNFSIRNDGTDPSIFTGKVALNAGLQNDNQTIAVIGSVVDTGSINTIAFTTPAISACGANGTTGATTISYKIVALDNNGYPTAASAQCQVTNANATLSAGNNVGLNISSAAATNPGVPCYAIYRTSTNGTSPTTTGRLGTVCTPATFFRGGQGVIQFVDTGLAPSVASATPPTAGAGTSIVANGITQSANTQRITGSNFTTSSASLVALFTWHLTGGASYSFHCRGLYQQATAAAGLTLGVQAGANTSAAPVNVSAQATIWTNTTGAASTYTIGTLATLATTTATNVLAGAAPAATGTNYPFEMDGGITMNATDPGDFVIMAATANASDQITILKDASYCQLF